ncbi:MAG: tRNA 2-thiouridine(34) synthase MnmA [Actinomycetota bacterium]
MAEIMVGMSGGVDSSVAAALLQRQGHRVVGVTLKLWGGESDSGCCSVSDVDDARRVARTLGIEHHVFNFGDDFDRHVVDPYVADHAAGRTPNPCVECNRHIKFDKLLRRAEALGFGYVATGHHARIVTEPAEPAEPVEPAGTAGPGVEHSGDELRRFVARGADAAKDQSYVLYMLDQYRLARTVLPVGDLTKDEVRAIAAELELDTAAKPDSQDVCFIHSQGGRRQFLGERIPLAPADLIDTDGRQLGRVSSVELVTIGQRRGLDLGGDEQRRYVVDIDRSAGLVTVGHRADLMTGEQPVGDVVWADTPVTGPLDFQCSAHGTVRAGSLTATGDGTPVIEWRDSQPKVAEGQSIAFYRGDTVVGGALARSG